jgi:hypothetical protein
MKFSHHLILGLVCLAALPVQGATQTERIHLSGRDKDDSVRWEFFCTAGRNSGFWTNILVPSNWELQGFGAYDYGQVPRAEKHSEQGKYRHSFQVPANWTGKRVFLVFEGVMTDAEVLVNGHLAGPPHQGGFYRFSYEVSAFLQRGGTNLLEVNVSKISADPSVEDAERQADYWVFGGIYRPVYLEAVPAAFIERTAVDAKADGSFRLNVHLQGPPAGARVNVRVLDSKERPVGDAISAAIQAGETNITLRTAIADVKPWSAETPNLYHTIATLEQGGRVIHQTATRFGFRTIEVRPGKGLFLNGQRILLQGANRHSFWPDSGRCLSRQVCFDDARLIKSMNMNAVRMSHYPPDTDFLEACDELGLYVLDELAGWQKPPYDTGVGRKLVREMVTRDVNHPSILFWDNGNEGGWNTELDADFWLYDPQRRTVLHPWQSNQGINTAHYRPFSQHLALLEGRAIPDTKLKYVPGDLYLPTEFLHGLYDGGHGGGLRDYWSAIRASPLGAGGFLWALVDEGVVRTDEGGKIDCAGNLAPDGIVGPYREREGSYDTIKELWSPVQVLTTNLPPRFNGVLEIANQYSFINLNQCRFNWKLVDFRRPTDAGAGHVIRHAGTLAGPDLKPGERGRLRLPLPQDQAGGDALMVTAYGPRGEDLWTWSWPRKSAAELTRSLVPSGQRGKVTTQVNGNILEVAGGTLKARFDLSSGLLLGANRDGVQYSLANGPRLCPAPPVNSAPVVRHGSGKGGSHVIEAVEGPLQWVWTIQPTGFLELECSYSITGPADFHGITFDYPEAMMREKTWLGGGPYHVWKNRMQGVRTDVWRTAYNDPTPGEQWEYPEFKGYFRDLIWMKLLASEGQFTVLNETPGLFLRVGTPRPGRDPKSAFAAFPEGQISFLHGIAPIGNKFQPSATTGPAGQPNQVGGNHGMKLRFVFGTAE